MALLTTILFWTGILLMVDGSLALLLQERWQKLLEGYNIRRIALVELAIAVTLITAHYLLAGRAGG